MKKTLLLSFVLVAFTGFIFAQGSDTKPEVEALKLFNEGNSLYRSGSYKGAIEKYDQALKLQQDPRFYYQRALAYKALKQNDEAIKSFEEAIKLKPDFAFAYNGLAGIYLLQGDYDKAIENYKKALSYDSKLEVAIKGIVEALIGKANASIQAGKFQDALEFLTEAVTYRQDYDKPYVMLAMVYNKLSQYDKAIESAKKAIELKPKGSNADAYFELGVAYKKLGQIEEARKAFTEAKKDPRLARNAQYELDLLKEQ